MLDEKGNYSHDASADYARESLQLSLKNLGVDYIDLYILRSKGQGVSIEDSIKGMAVGSECLSLYCFAAALVKCKQSCLAAFMTLYPHCKSSLLCQASVVNSCNAHIWNTAKLLAYTALTRQVIAAAQGIQYVVSGGRQQLHMPLRHV